MTDFRANLKQEFTSLAKAVTGKETKLPYVLVDNQEILYKLLVYLFSKIQFLGVEASHFSLTVDGLQSMYSIESSKLVYNPNIIYLPKPGRYSAQYKGRTFWLTFTCGQKAWLTTALRNIQYERSLKIQTVGDSVQPIVQLIDQAFKQIDHSNQGDLIVYENIGAGWAKTKGKKSRSLKSVILDKSISNSLVEDIQQFIESKEWYTKLGVPYRRVYLLQGPPGTGKSSFAQAIAGHLKLSLCFVNISDRSLNDHTFNRLMNKSPKQSIILLEDIDAMFDGRKNSEDTNRLTYSGFLNAIDGVRSQQGRIIIMTTNHKQKLDPALLRPGRVDMSIKLNYATKFQVQALFQRFFGNLDLAEKVAQKVPENTFSMAQLQGFFVKYRKTPDLILKNIKQLLTTQQNVKIDNWLTQIGCTSAIPFFKMQGYSTLASVKNLANQTITALLTSRLSNQKIVRLIQSIRSQSFSVLRSKQDLFKIIQQNLNNSEVIQKFKRQVLEKQIRTNFQLMDAIKEHNDKIQKQQS